MVVTRLDASGLGMAIRDGPSQDQGMFSQTVLDMVSPGLVVYRLRTGPDLERLPAPFK